MITVARILQPDPSTRMLRGGGDGQNKELRLSKNALGQDLIYENHITFVFCRSTEFIGVN